MDLDIILIIILINSFSFFIYGVNSLYSNRMINEFKRWGFSKYRKHISILQILGATGLVVGIKYNLILVISSLGLSIMMFFAILVRVKIQDNISRVLPGMTYLLLNIIILYYSLSF